MEAIDQREAANISRALAKIGQINIKKQDAQNVEEAKQNHQASKVTVRECLDMEKDIEKAVAAEKVVDLNEFRKEIKETMKEFEDNLKK